MRRQDWPAALAAALERAGAEPFEWGRHDCCSWVCDAVAAMTGADPMAALRGRYRTVKGARRLVKDGGLPALAARLAAAAGLAELPPALAWRGDVLLVEAADLLEPGFGAALALRAGTGCAVLTPAGLATLPLAAAARAWAVR